MNHYKIARQWLEDDPLRPPPESLGKDADRDCRPWGYYEVLTDSRDHKVKRIVVHPGKRISLQRHRRRAECWTIISGNPVVTVDGREVQLSPGDFINIPLGATHRITNPGTCDVIFIEVQTGEYFGEDDIERFEDDFGRM